MRRKTIVAGLVVLNLVLGAAQFAAPAVSQIIPLGLFDCCKTDGPDGEPFCCRDCCWITQNCISNQECAIDPDSRVSEPS